MNELEARLDQDPVAAREELRRYFDGGKIKLRVDEHGRHVADWALRAGILLDDTYIAVPGVSGERRIYVGGSGGAKPEYPETRIRLKGFIRRY